MKASILTAIYFFAFFFFTAHSQDLKISWRNNEKPTENYGDAIQLSNGNYLLVKTKAIERFEAPILVLVDPDMSIIKETTVELVEKKAKFKTLRKFGNNVFLTYEEYKNKQVTGYALRLNQQTLLPETKIILFSLEEEDFGELSHVIYKVSADSTKVLVFAQDYGKKKENKQVYIGAFDTSLKKIWSRFAELPMRGCAVTVTDQDITDDNRVFVAVKHYEKCVVFPSMRDIAIDENVPPYDYKLFVFSKAGTPRELKFELENHFIESTRLVFDKNGLVTAAGLYKKKPNGNITGAFYTSFDSTTTVIKNNKMLAFPPGILALVDKDDYGNSTGSDPGVSRHLRIKDILKRKNGTVDLVSEIQEAVSDEKSTDYTYGDIINVNLDKAGHVLFTRIPKRQLGYHSDWALSYFPVVHGDKLVLLYNDHEDNMTRDLSKAPVRWASAKNSVLAAAIIDDKGNLTRRAVQDFDDQKRMAMPMDFSLMSGTKYRIVSMTGSRFSNRLQYGVLEIK